MPNRVPPLLGIMQARLISSDNRHLHARAHYQDDLLFIETQQFKTAIDVQSPNIRITRSGYSEVVQDSASGISIVIDNHEIPIENDSDEVCSYLYCPQGCAYYSGARVQECFVQM